MLRNCLHIFPKHQCCHLPIAGVVDSSSSASLGLRLRIELVLRWVPFGSVVCASFLENCRPNWNEMTLGLTERGQKGRRKRGKKAKNQQSKRFSVIFALKYFAFVCGAKNAKVGLFFSYFLLYYINNKKQAHLFALRMPFLATEHHGLAGRGRGEGRGEGRGRAGTWFIIG